MRAPTNKVVPYWEIKKGVDDPYEIILTRHEETMIGLADMSGARLRDLRPIQPGITLRQNGVLARDRAILFYVWPYRCICLHDRALLFDVEVPGGPRPVALEGVLRERIRKTAVNHDFELRVLESLLIEATEHLHYRSDKLLPAISRLLDELPSNHSAENMQTLLAQSIKLHRFIKDVKMFRRAMGELLASDEDMASMYLSDKARGHPRTVTDHEEVELLIETHDQLAQEIASRLDSARSDIQLTNQFVEIQYDETRNKLIHFNIVLTTGSLSVGFATLLAGAFGMNLVSGFEEHPTAFYWVSGGMGCTVAGVMVLASILFQRTRSVRRHDLTLLTRQRSWEGTFKKGNDTTPRYLPDRENK